MKVRPALVVRLLAAGLLASALVAVATAASRRLAEGDAAVRERALVRCARELEAALRDEGAGDGEGIEEVVATFGASRHELLAGIEVVGPGGLLARWGTPAPSALRLPAALGREWRFRTGRRVEGGRPAPGDPAGAAVVLLLTPAPLPLLQRTLPAALVAVAVVSAAGLVALASRQGSSPPVEPHGPAPIDAERERLDALGLAGAGLARRLRVPLAGVEARARLLAREVEPPVRERIEGLADAAGRAARLVDDALALEQAPAPGASRVDLASLPERLAAFPGVAFRVEGPAPVEADGEQLARVVEELLARARAACPDGPLEVAVRTEGPEAIVEVSDRGETTPHPARAFDPYVHPTGLGLPLARTLARANGGELRLLPRDGGGATVRLSFPLAAL